MFKSRKEKIAYKQGIKKGRSGGRVWKGRDDPPYIKSTSNSKYKYKSDKSDKYWDDFFNASVKKSNSKKAAHDDFDRDKKGRIKGSYTSDGFFEPD